MFCSPLSSHPIALFRSCPVQQPLNEGGEKCNNIMPAVHCAVLHMQCLEVQGSIIIIITSQYQRVFINPLLNIIATITFAVSLHMYNVMWWFYANFATYRNHLHNAQSLPTTCAFQQLWASHRLTPFKQPQRGILHVNLHLLLVMSPIIATSHWFFLFDQINCYFNSLSSYNSCLAQQVCFKLPMLKTYVWIMCNKCLAHSCIKTIIIIITILLSTSW